MVLAPSIRDKSNIFDDVEKAPLHDECAPNHFPRPSPPTSTSASSSSSSQSKHHDNAKSKRIITLSLLRKRSEHNEGLVSSLEELALHQEELQSIGPVLGRTCGRTLKILLLQNNVIDRMVPAELKLFRSLEYLNLALNNVTEIEGVRGMEWLRKLDLTLNFIDVDSLEGSVDELSECRSLEELFFLGNPCMGLDDGSIPGLASNDAATTTSSPKPQERIGWKGCRAYIVARLPNLQFLDGKEIKRSDRIVAMQQLPALTLELRLLAETRRKERLIRNHQTEERCDEVDESYISDDAPTHHNPETRTKISNELYDQKQAKEEQATTNQPPKPKGEKEWEEEQNDTVQKVREREERGREFESRNKTNNKITPDVKKDGGIKQCNQGKYQFWFEEESNKTSSTNQNGNKAGTFLIMRVAIPKHLSTSLIDVDIHPTYASVVIKSKILRVTLPVEVVSDKSTARRSAASGYLELVMPKVDPDEILIGMAHVRDYGKNRKDAAIDNRNQGSVQESGIDEGKLQKKRECLGQSILKEVGMANPLQIVPNQISDNDASSLKAGDDSDDDEVEPPPLC